jgi:methylase of polypeptide subunit release factors
MRREPVNPETSSWSSDQDKPVLNVLGIGDCLFPGEFHVFTGPPGAIELHDARESPRLILERLASGIWVVLKGPYLYVDAVYHYCQHYERDLVSVEEFSQYADRLTRRAKMVEQRRRKLHHILLVLNGETFVNVKEGPNLGGLREWLAEPVGETPYLIPLRRLQRILVDMRRAREGIQLKSLEEPITILPHVYVPYDQSVPAMFAEYKSLMRGKRVLDMGTGTGVLAILAAQLGASEVVATDISPKAVENARLNVESLRFGGKISVRPPADLFDAVKDESFDVIIFNVPWIEGEPKTLYDVAIYDPERRILKGFLERAAEYLAPSGVILVQCSDISCSRGEGFPALFETLAAANGLRIAGSRSISRTSRTIGSKEKVYVVEIRRSGDE